jgi:hypothetical protein
MEFNFDEVFNGMLSIFGENLKNGGEEVSAYGQKILSERKADLENISKIYAGKFLKLVKQYESELEDEKTTLESQLLAGEVIVKSTAQKAINEAMDFLVGAVKKLI